MSDCITHIWKEAKKCADFLARECHNHEEAIIIWEVSLKEMEFLLLANSSNAVYERF